MEGLERGALCGRRRLRGGDEQCHRLPPALCDATASCRAGRHHPERRSHAATERLFRGALDELAQLGEPINSVLEVDIEGDEVTFSFYDLPVDGG